MVDAVEAPRILQEAACDAVRAIGEEGLEKEISQRVELNKFDIECFIELMASFGGADDVVEADEHQLDVRVLAARMAAPFQQADDSEEKVIVHLLWQLAHVEADKQFVDHKVDDRIEGTHIDRLILHREGHYLIKLVETLHRLETLLHRQHFGGQIVHKVLVGYHPKCLRRGPRLMDGHGKRAHLRQELVVL